MRTSITHRLALLFGLVSCAGLLALGLYLSVAIEGHFEQLDREALDAMVAQIRAPGAHLHAPGGGALIWQGDERAPQPAEDHPVPFPPAAETALAASAPGHGVLFTWDDGGRAFRGLAARFAADGAHPATSIVAAIDIEHHRRFMEKFRAALWAAVLGAILVSTSLGALVARLSMRPLRRFADHARSTSSAHLGKPLATADLPAELLELGDAFNDMLARLDDAFTRLSAFSADIAHELRTPVANLLTQTQVTLALPRSPAEYREVLASNAEELERIGRMVSDMLFLAKADNGLALPRPEDVDLTQEVDEVLEFYEALAEECGVRLQRSGEAGTTGDRLMLRRAINNLLSNALRYAPAGGCVTVRLQEDAAHCRVTVSNPGAPISPEAATRLFDRFYRSEAARSRSSDGAGLGLAITRSIVLAHGGSVFAHSAAGSNHFGFVLPRHPGPPSDAARPTGAARASTPRPSRAAAARP